MTRGPLTVQVERFKALGHPARLRLAAMLARGELCVCQMTAGLQLAPSTGSAHLAELRRAGLVQERKDGRWVFYALDEDGRRLLDDVAGALSADAQVREDAVAAPGALIGASNFFERAVATAIALYGAGSGAALATVVGVLVEVPVMLSVCHLCLATRGWFERDCPASLPGGRRLT